MQTPDWTHFRSAEVDPTGPCCLLERSFPTNELPRNYIWTIGYLGVWINAEDAEISAQVRSYSRQHLIERAKLLDATRKEQAFKQMEYQRLVKQRDDEMNRLTAEAMKNPDNDELKRRIEASPMQMVKGLVKSATDLATGGITDPTKRMEICNSCPFKGDDGRCGKCGCVLAAKTRVKKSSCPINRW
jgi:hypothetical protein